MVSIASNVVNRLVQLMHSLLRRIFSSSSVGLESITLLSRQPQNGHFMMITTFQFLINYIALTIILQGKLFALKIVLILGSRWAYQNFDDTLQSEQGLDTPLFSEQKEEDQS